MTSEALNPSWQLGDRDIQIGNASLQLVYKDVSPTSRSSHVKGQDKPPGTRPRKVPSVMLGVRR